MRITLPYQLDDYRLEELIGRGGMGAIYKAVDQNGREVAVKILEIHSLERDSREERIQRFEREAIVLAKLKSPNIVECYQYGKYSDPAQNLHVYYIAMEYVRNNLAKKFEERRRLKVDTALVMLYQIAEGLREAHENGIIHRDIKPENILITPEGLLKIIDFGVARLQEQTSSNLTKTGVLLGSVHYMSPEVINCLKGIIPQSDIFSLGVLLYYMITGVMPFQGSIDEIIEGILNQTPLPPSYRNPTISEEVNEFTMKMLAKIPEQRHADIPALQSDILAMLFSYARSSPRQFFKTCAKYKGFNYGDLVIYAHAYNEQQAIIPFIFEMIRKAITLRHIQDGVKFLDMIEYNIDDADEDIRIYYYIISEQYEETENYDMEIVIDIGEEILECHEERDDGFWDWLSQRARYVIQKVDITALKQRCARILKFTEKENREVWEIWEKINDSKKREKLDALRKLLKIENKPKAVSLIGEMVVLRTCMEFLEDLPENSRLAVLGLLKDILLSRENARNKVIFSLSANAKADEIERVMDLVRLGYIDIYAGDEVEQVLNLTRGKELERKVSLMNPDVERRNNLLEGKRDFSYYLKVFADKFNQVVFLENLGTKLDFSRSEFPSGDKISFLREFFGHELSELCVSLNLSRREVGDGGVEAILAGEHLTNLKTLVLSNNSLSDEAVTAIAQEKKLSGLTCLDLSGNQISDRSVVKIARSKTLTGLTHLNLSDNRITDRGACIISKSKSLCNLEILDLSNNTIGRVERNKKFILFDLAFLVCYFFDLFYRIIYYFMKKLLESHFVISRMFYFALSLLLHGIYTFDLRSGARHIGSQRRLKSLKFLNLGGNYLHDHGVERIVTNRVLKSLESLNLSHSRITDIAAKKIARSKTLSKIRHLNLSRNPIGDLGAREMAESRHLDHMETLNLSYTKISGAGKEIFKSRRWKGIAEFDIVKGKEGQRIIMNQQELGLTERIKRVLLDQ